MINAIFALARDGAFGHGLTLPWCIGPDLARFKQLTTGHPIVMGRRTYESIGRPLPRRRNIVVTSDPSRVCPKPNAVVPTVGEALLDALSVDSEVFVIGGVRVLEEAWHHVERVYLTEVHADYPDADVRFCFDRGGWRELAREDHVTFSFVELARSR